MKRLWRGVRQFLSREREEGAAMVEYALLICLIALGAMLGVTSLGTTLQKMFRSMHNTMATIPSNGR